MTIPAQSGFWLVTSTWIKGQLVFAILICTEPHYSPLNRKRYREIKKIQNNSPKFSFMGAISDASAVSGFTIHQ
jgi:hypothetical protein